MEFDISTLPPERQERFKEADGRTYDENWQPSPEDREQIEVIMQKPWKVEITVDRETGMYCSFMPEAGACGFGETEEEARQSVYSALHLTVLTMAYMTVLDLVPEPVEPNTDHAKG